MDFDMSSQDRHSYVEFFPSDWRGGTARMTPMQEWTYLQICLENWDKAEPMRKGQVALFLSSNPTWRDDLQMLVDAGKVVKTGGGDLFVRRALNSALKAKELWERKSRGGKNAAKSKADAKSLGKSPASNENENENESKDKSLPPYNPPAGDLVFSPPEPQWSDFKKHRKAIGKPMTAQAEKLTLRKLEGFAAKGLDPGFILERSIENGWTGIFDPTEGRSNADHRSSGNGRARPVNGFRDALNEAIAATDPDADEFGRGVRPH